MSRDLGPFPRDPRGILFSCPWINDTNQVEPEVVGGLCALPFIEGSTRPVVDGWADLVVRCQMNLGLGRVERRPVWPDGGLQKRAQSLAAVWTTTFPPPAASEPRPGTLRERGLAPGACGDLGCTWHVRPPRSRLHPGPHLAEPRGAQRYTEMPGTCWALCRALKETRATSAGRSNSSGRTGHGRQTCEGI